MNKWLNRDLISIADYSSEEASFVLDAAISLKRDPGQVARLAEGKTLAMLFEKQSLRTRVTFETAMTQMGGHGIYLQPADIGLGTREPVKDIARCLARWCQAIMARTYKHETIVELAEYADIQVINALSDWEHPCQALADFQALREHLGELRGRTLAYVGDGNNVAHSLMLLAAKLGMNCTIGCPADYAPDAKITEQASAFATATGATIQVLHDPIAAVTGADAVYTDVWTSMGQEKEREERLRVFPPFQINAELLSYANPGALIMHCLPAHRGEEITDEAVESKYSVIFDEAEKRLHAQKAVLALGMGWLPD